MSERVIRGVLLLMAPSVHYGLVAFGLGIVLELVARNLSRQRTTMKIVGTVGLTVMVPALCLVFYPTSNNGLRVERFIPFSDRARYRYRILDVNIFGDQLVTAGVAIVAVILGPEEADLETVFQAGNGRQIGGHQQRVRCRRGCSWRRCQRAVSAGAGASSRWRRSGSLPRPARRGSGSPHSRLPGTGTPPADTRPTRDKSSPRMCGGTATRL